MKFFIPVKSGWMTWALAVLVALTFFAVTAAVVIAWPSLSYLADGLFK